MNIVQTFKYEKDGKVGVGNKVPEGATVTETMNILQADKDKVLVRKQDGEVIGFSFWLREEDAQENYEEVDDKKSSEMER